MWVGVLVVVVLGGVIVCVGFGRFCVFGVSFFDGEGVFL